MKSDGLASGTTITCPTCGEVIIPIASPNPPVGQDGPHYDVICPLCYWVFETHDGDYRNWGAKP